MEKVILSNAAMSLIPEAVAVLGLSFLMLMVWLISRAVTIRHFSKHHLGEIAQREILEKSREINALQAEVSRLLMANEQLNLMVKGARAALNIGDLTLLREGSNA